MNYLRALSLMFTSTAAFSSVPTAIGSNSVDPFSTANLTQWTIGLFFVLLLILIVAWAAKRFTGLASSHKGHLKVLSGVSLGHREKAVLIQAGNQHLLLGVAPGRVVTLHTFEAGEISQSLSQEEAVPTAFQDSLKKVMNKKGAE
ncbi:MAG: flagellar biosynthetic protein FliO [Cycloclasticus pugetii]|jgi:flagellar protein FliO/FliZ|nr:MULTISPECIES: flagellar biosynthetic protein FliO [Cycloclasticus]MDF1828474.1 flagellar biosynthetic protein FliO [Cycloclasticus pugetii]